MSPAYTRTLPAARLFVIASRLRRRKLFNVWWRRRVEVPLERGAAAGDQTMTHHHDHHFERLRTGGRLHLRCRQIHEGRDIENKRTVKAGAKARPEPGTTAGTGPSAARARGRAAPTTPSRRTGAATLSTESNRQAHLTCSPCGSGGVTRRGVRGAAREKHVGSFVGGARDEHFDWAHRRTSRGRQRILVSVSMPPHAAMRSSRAPAAAAARRPAEWQRRAARSSKPPSGPPSRRQTRVLPTGGDTSG